jgi:hypothetical protein
MPTPGTRVNLTEADIARIVDYTEEELNESLAVHQQKEERIDKWQDAYDGRPERKRKDFPWPGACNVVIPLIGIAVDSIVARLVNTLFSVEPFWSIRPIQKAMEQPAKPLEDFHEWSRQNEFNMYAETRKWVPEVVKFGWGYIKVPWTVQTQRVFEIDQFGEPTPKDRVLRYPNPQHIPLRDMVTQAGIEDEINQAEWLAQRVRLTDGQLRWRQYDGIYDDVEEVIEKKDDYTEYRKLANESVIIPKQKLNTFYELWADLPLTSKNALPDKVVYTYHRPTKRILRMIYNPNITGKRGFVKGKFIEREGELEGQGIAVRLADMQAEITTIHCQQVDNATLANTRFFVGRRGVVRPNTKVWPGRFLTVPDPEKDVKAVQLGDVYNSMSRLSTEILAFSERASGVSDPFLGRESSVVGTRATATGTLAILQEGNRRFDLNVRDIRDALSEVGRMVLELNQQYRPRGMAIFIQGEDGVLTEAMLDMPNEYLLSRVAVELTASTATINRSVEQQGLLSLLGVLSQYYQQVLQLGFLMTQEQVPQQMREFMGQMMEGAKFIMQRLVRTFDVKDIDAVLPTFMAEVNNGAGSQADGVSARGATSLGGLDSFLGAPQGATAAPGNGGVGG